MGASLPTQIKMYFNKMETSHSSSTKKCKVTNTPTAGKVTFTLFWDPQGVLRAHFQKHGENVNSASYCEVLLKLQDAIHGNVKDN
jgi:hypothetical protein